MTFATRIHRDHALRTETMTASAPATNSSAAAHDVPIQLRGGSFTLLVLRMGDPRDQTFYTRLADKIGQAPNFYRHAPVVVDLADLADAPPFNIAELGRRLRQHSLIPVAVQNGTDEQNRAAVNAGFALMPEGRPAAGGDPILAPATSKPAATGRAARSNGSGDPRQPTAATAAVVGTTTVVMTPVRSGRQIYAHRGDLIVLSPTSPGAELLADGHIHVYGALRGRALAGVAGDAGARIFCLGLEAELVSIAGYWRVRDDLPDALIGKPVQIYLAGEQVVVEPLT